jgi:uncharacterized membrane protein (DUF485 family)
MNGPAKVTITRFTQFTRKPRTMKDFLIRIGLLLPLTVFAVYLLFILIGWAASLMGATNLFYCTVYCKLGVSVLIGALIVVLYCQAKACSRQR